MSSRCVSVIDATPLTRDGLNAQVVSVFRRVADPEVREREEAAEKARKEAAAKVAADKADGDKRAGKKAGSWGGL